VPGRAACVLELHAGAAVDSRLELADLVAEPPNGERPGGNGMGGNCLHFRG
jgi:hypothetical protein